MTTIRVTRHLESDTIQIPELAGLIGKDVEITVREELPACSGVPSGKSDVRAFLALAGHVSVDPDALWELREASKL